MPEYRRWRVEAGTYFFTLVTGDRRPILTTELGRTALREAFAEVHAEKPFEVFAILLLPDHLHCIWNLPALDADFSSRWADIKTAFTKRFLAGGGVEAAISKSRHKKGERGVWQRRFWEHLVRDEDDLKRCLDYLHYNPCKHGHVVRVKDWPWSSFHRFVTLGEYPENWGSYIGIPCNAAIFGED